MSVEQGGGRRAPVVRPIYRRGDRVLVELPSGKYLLLIEAAEIIGGELWLEGKASEFSKLFPARCVIRRLKPGESFTRPRSA
jgi:hypothetical protein